MPIATNFHPEWGYLAPAPSFMRTARIVAVATAIGATAGGAVVLSLAGSGTSGPQADAGMQLVVVHSLVQPAEAAVPSATQLQARATPEAPVKAQSGMQPGVQTSTPPVAQPPSVHIASPPPAAVAPFAPAASESRAVTTAATPASVAALAEIPPVTDAAPAQGINQVSVAPDPIAPDQAAADKKAKKNHGDASNTPPANAGQARRSASNNGGLGSMLRHLFSARSGTSYYPN
jgi:hypothetical protein